MHLSSLLALVALTTPLAPLFAVSTVVVMFTVIAMSALLTPHEAAARLRVKIATLRTWRWRGTGPKFIRQGTNPKGRVLYDEADLSSYLEAHRYGSTSEETASRQPSA